MHFTELPSPSSTSTYPSKTPRTIIIPDKIWHETVCHVSTKAFLETPLAKALMQRKLEQQHKAERYLSSIQFGDFHDRQQSQGVEPLTQRKLSEQNVGHARVLRQQKLGESKIYQHGSFAQDRVKDRKVSWRF